MNRLLRITLAAILVLGLYGQDLYHLDYARSFAAHREWSGEGTAVDSHSVLRLARISHLVVSHCRV